MKNVFILTLLSTALSVPAMAQLSSVVETLPVEIRSVSETIELVGTAEANRRSMLAAQTEGVVRERRVEAGDEVSAGQTIVIQDVDLIQANLEAMAASEAAARALYEKQQQTLKRSTTLFERGRISEEAFQSDKLQAENLSQRLTQISAERKQMEILRERKTIRAPYDGVLTAVLTEAGEWLTPGSPVAELVDDHRLDIVANMPEKWLPDLQRDLPIHLRPASRPDETYTGTLEAAIPDSNPATRTLPVRIEVDNADGTLHPGMDMRVTLPVSASREVITVSKDALLNQRGTWMVYRITDGKIDPVPVTQKGAFGDVVEVEAPLSEGDLIVVRGNERVFPGQDVQHRPLTERR